MTVQRSVDDILAGIRHDLNQRERATRSWEEQSKQWEARWQDVTRQLATERAAHDATKASLAQAQAERDYLARELATSRERLAAADDALAGMVLQYMQFPEGYISHEFMSAQEDAIEYLENIGWLKAGEYERYYWTPESPDGKWQAEKHGLEDTTPVSLPNQSEETQVPGQEPPASLLAAARAACASKAAYTEDVAFVDAALLRVLEDEVQG